MIFSLLQVGQENAHLALELVGYDSHVQAAMAHVFGNTFICTNSEHARKVTFDKQVSASRSFIWFYMDCISHTSDALAVRYAE